MELPTLPLILICLGALISVVGGLWLLISAFRESILWGLIVIFAPCGNLIFTCCHWATARRPFIVGTAGFALLVGGFLLIPNIKEGITQALQTQYPNVSIPGVIKKPAAADLNAQIAEKRKALEDLQGSFATLGRDLPGKYQQLEQRRKSLKTGDDTAIAKFNADAAAYQAQNQQMKQLQQQIAGTQSALDQLLDTRSRAALVANRSGASAGAGAGSGPVSNKPVVMYTTATCPACKVAKQYMAQKGIPYREIDVQSNEEGMQAFRQLGGNGVPLIMVGDQRMEGFNSQRLEQMLAAG